MKDGICYIFGAGDFVDCQIDIQKNDLVIAADGGFDYIKKLGLMADFVLGDFDSVLSKDLPSDAISYPSQKDDTDMMLAVKLGLEKGYKNFSIYGGLGGRLDHTLGNIQILNYLSQNKASGILYGNKYKVTVITNGTVNFTKESSENSPGNICSIFSLSDTSKGVTISGFKYKLSNSDLTNSFPLGVSNEFLGKKAFVHVEKGSLIIISQC